jgi:hypothetical protein
MTVTVHYIKFIAPLIINFWTSGGTKELKNNKRILKYKLLKQFLSDVKNESHLNSV